MIQEYFKAANQVMELAEQCEDQEIVNILKAGSSRIFDLAQSKGGILKHASLELSEEVVEEEAFTGTE